jgi:glucosamine--fructose-6-phosphate aminotransferase (isomerizing)
MENQAKTHRGQHTWAEITGQPEAWRATLGTFAAGREVLEDFLKQADFARILVLGCGSTYYLAQTAAAILSRCTRTPAHALPSSELWLFPDTAPPGRTLLLAVSRSGTTTETLRALERFREIYRGSVLAITCYPESSLSQQADFTLATPAGQEQSVAQTRSFTSMLLLAQALAANLAQDEEMMEQLHRLPDALEDLVARLGDLPQTLGTDLDIESIYFLGGGSLYGLANEAMLKTKEMSISYAEAYHPLEFRHGPMSMARQGTLIVGLFSDAGMAEELRVLKEMQSYKAHTLALIEDGSAFSDWRADHVVELRSGLNECEREPLFLPMLQRMAYHRALAKGLDPDRPNNLTAVVEL